MIVIDNDVFLSDIAGTSSSKYIQPSSFMLLSLYHYSHIVNDILRQKIYNI